VTCTTPACRAERVASTEAFSSLLPLPSSPPASQNRHVPRPPHNLKHLLLQHQSQCSLGMTQTSPTQKLCQLLEKQQLVSSLTAAKATICVPLLKLLFHLIRRMVCFPCFCTGQTQNQTAAQQTAECRYTCRVFSSWPDKHSTSCPFRHRRRFCPSKSC
jgi:hypothetical protein